MGIRHMGGGGIALFLLNFSSCISLVRFFVNLYQTMPICSDHKHPPAVLGRKYFDLMSGFISHIPIYI